MNNDIRAPKVRVVDNAGKQLGVMATSEAVRLAREQELDLVEMSSTSVPPVCRILDHGKLRYLQAKKNKEARKSQKSTSLREVQFRGGPNIADHDLGTKIRKVQELLAGGDKVKVSVRFRGRQQAHPENGMQLLRKVVDVVKEESNLDKVPTMEGRTLSLVLTPIAQKINKKEQVKSA